MLNSKQSTNVALLIEALLSGDFQQGRKRLHDPITGQYDILGVMAELFKFPKVGGEFFFGSHSDRRVGYSSKYALPPIWVKQNFGVDSTQLVYFNDDVRWSFPQLALHLSCYLSDGPSKSALRQRIEDVLRLDAKRQIQWVAAVSKAM